MIDLDALWTELSEAARVPLDRKSFRFDPAHYAEIANMPGTGADELNRHYLLTGQARDLSPNRYHWMRKLCDELDERLARVITEPRLSEAMRMGHPGAAELACELLALGAPLDARLSDFSARHYEATNPGVREAGADPLTHYLLHGIAEGRQTLTALREREHAGKRAFDPDLPTVLITAHELRKTGAPMVSIDLAREASKTHNVVFAALTGGPLLEAACEHAVAVAVTPRAHDDFPFFDHPAFGDISMAVLNSVESLPFVKYLVAHDLPFACYLHEYTYYSRPDWKCRFAAMFGDLLVFSSDHVRDSWNDLFADLAFDRDRDSTIVPQHAVSVGSVSAARMTEARASLARHIGRDCEGRRIVCGAGLAQWRKGTDIFAITATMAARRDPDTLFIWVGDGLNPDDLGFGAWTDFHLRQIGVNDPEGNLFVLPAGPHYADLLDAADAMFVSSRLDPLPNVVFDALKAGCRTVVFDGATGFGDAAYEECDHLVKVPYGDPEAALDALLSLPRKTPAADSENAPETPPQHVFREISDRLHRRLADQRHFVMGETDIDMSFVFGDGEDERTLRITERERIFSYGRRPIWRSVADARDTLARSGNPVHAACSVSASPEAAAAVPSELALHVHTPGAPRLTRLLEQHKAVREAGKLVVTTANARDLDAIRAVLDTAGMASEVLHTPSRDRATLPFLHLFEDGGPGTGSPLWAHLPLGAEGADPAGFAAAMDTLLGDAHHVSGAAARLSDTDIGMVATFRPRVASWGGTRWLLPRIAPRLGAGTLPDNPLLAPMGLPLLLRSELGQAMAALFGPDHAWPNEPHAADSTELSLVDRLWPAMAAQCGLSALFLVPDSAEDEA